MKFNKPFHSPQMALNDDLLALTFSYLDITDYRSEEITTFLLFAGCDNPEKIIDYWKKASFYETINDDGITMIKLNGKFHSNNGHAVEWSNGDKEWWLNGERHRLDGPAVECTNGDKEWWANGKVHRADGPAIIYENEHKEWWVNGKIHRSDGPAIEWSDGGKEWYANGERHRVEGPAVEWPNACIKQWWVDGKFKGTT